MIGCEKNAMPMVSKRRFRVFFPWLLAALLATGAPARAQDGTAGQEPRRPPFAVSVRLMSGDEITRHYDIGRLSKEENPDRLQRQKVPVETVAGLFVGPMVLFSGVRDSSASAVVVGPPHSLEFQQSLDGVRAALVGLDFPRLLADALRERASAAREAGSGAAGISVALAFYGLRTSDDRPTTLDVDDDFCLVAVGSAFALAAGGPGENRYFILGTNALSSGMEAPVCDSFRDYADQGGYRLTQVAQQTAANLADWLVANILAP